MKVAYLISEYPKVSHSFIRREIIALERLGVDVHRYAIRGPSDGSPDAADAEELKKTRYVLKQGAAAMFGSVLVTMIRRRSRFLSACFNTLRLSWRAERGLVHHLGYLVEACVVARWMDSAGIAHIHAHFGSNPATVAMLAAGLRGGTFSFTAHGTVETDAARFIAIPEKVRRAAMVIAVSEFGRSQLCRWVDPAHWGKIAVVHCGIDDGFRSPPVLDCNPVNRFVCVGRLSPEKGQFVLIEAVAALRRQGIDLELVLAGDGELRDAIERHAARLGIDDRIRITGWISGDAVREEIAAARALVLSSFAEGLPVVIMEAMATSRPVVATRVGGIPELVRDRVEGWLVGPGDVVALAEAMRECLAADAGQLSAMGARARARALDRHDVQKSAAALKAAFESVAAATSGPGGPNR
jgi:colanic acid/amylovoran biosynthesis glycosyltransferase